MRMEETISYHWSGLACAVGGKNDEGSGRFARVNRRGRMILLCCPICLETFEQNPNPYSRRLKKVDHIRSLFDLEMPLAEA